MAVFFRPHNEQACFLCGSTKKLTREHKIKASEIAKEFGTDPMVIGAFREGSPRPKYAQSPKSKNLTFAARICEACNTSRTQSADRAFVSFHGVARRELLSSGDPARAFDSPEFEDGSEQYLNLFRYFAKIMCCHLAEFGAPTPIHMSKFAIGDTDTNCIWLKVQKDYTFNEVVKYHSDFQFAAHGGLVIYTNKKTQLPSSFFSSITLGPIQYSYWSRMTLFELWELKLHHPAFLEFCKQRGIDAMENPIPAHNLKQLGLMDWES